MGTDLKFVALVLERDLVEKAASAAECEVRAHLWCWEEDLERVDARRQLDTLRSRARDGSQPARPAETYALKPSVAADFKLPDARAVKVEGRVHGLVVAILARVHHARLHHPVQPNAARTFSACLARWACARHVREVHGEVGGQQVKVGGELGNVIARQLAVAEVGGELGPLKPHSVCLTDQRQLVIVLPCTAIA